MKRYRQHAGGAHTSRRRRKNVNEEHGTIEKRPRRAWLVKPVAAAMVTVVAASLAVAGAVPGASGIVGTTLVQKAGAAGVVPEFAASSVASSPDDSSIYATSVGDAISIFDRDATGTLTKKSGTSGCISDTGLSENRGIQGACVDGKALGDATSVAVSPDGRSVYVASAFTHAIAIFDRASNGALLQKAGTAACVSESGFDEEGESCADGKALIGARSVAVSPDGTSVYLATDMSDGVAVFDRSPSGALTQKAGQAGCITETGAPGTPPITQAAPSNALVATQSPCVDGKALDGARWVTVSPDGASVYVAADGSDAVAVFDRSSTGALTQKAGQLGCVSLTGSDGGCADGRALDGAASVAVSADGSSVYVAADRSDAVAIFDRTTPLAEPAPTPPVLLSSALTQQPGILTQKAGTAGCISENGAEGEFEPVGVCADGSGLVGANSVTVSRDGTSAYATSWVSDAVDIFSRTSNGGLSQAADPAGCIGRSAPTGACVAGSGLDNARQVVATADGRSAYVAALNAGAVAVFDRTKIDLTPPTVEPPPLSPETAIVSDPYDSTHDRSPTFAFTSSKQDARFECAVDGAAFTACTSPVTLPLKAAPTTGKRHRRPRLSIGTHTFAVRAIDAEGNVDPTPATDGFTVLKRHRKHRAR
jgi:DNA-binding beta-propeller fold protein YncE